MHCLLIKNVGIYHHVKIVWRYWRVTVLFVGLLEALLGYILVWLRKNYKYDLNDCFNI